MKKISFVLIFSLICSAQVFAEQNAYSIVQEASKKGTADESVSYISKIAPTLTAASEKRALYAFLGSLQEQLGLYDQAEKSYVTAAGISAQAAENMPKKTNEQLVLDAVRCALNAGNYTSANSYLNSSVRNSKDEKIQCYIKLYSVWSALCKAETTEDLEEPLALLKAYSNVASMKEVQPAILLTLWYITGDNSYSADIKKRFPSSPEASIVKGDSQLLPSPFWYFVPKAGVATPETGTVKDLPKEEKQETKTSDSTKTEPQNKTAKSVKTRLQLGLFSSEANAKALVDELKKKGFDAYTESEKKPSGNVYYLVLVDEKDGTIADRLRSSGYECYLVE